MCTKITLYSYIKNGRIKNEFKICTKKTVLDVANKRCVTPHGENYRNLLKVVTPKNVVSLLLEILNVEKKKRNFLSHYMYSILSLSKL
jgi:hypothetical protein